MTATHRAGTLGDDVDTGTRCGILSCPPGPALLGEVVMLLRGVHTASGTPATAQRSTWLVHCHPGLGLAMKCRSWSCPTSRSCHHGLHAPTSARTKQPTQIERRPGPAGLAPTTSRNGASQPSSSRTWLSAITASYHPQQQTKLTVYELTWPALPAGFGTPNSVWKHSAVIRAHVAAAGAR